MAAAAARKGRLTEAVEKANGRMAQDPATNMTVARAPVLIRQYRGVPNPLATFYA